MKLQRMLDHLLDQWLGPRKVSVLLCDSLLGEENGFLPLPHTVQMDFFHGQLLVVLLIDTRSTEQFIL
jgi:hypothetical protein